MSWFSDELGAMVILISSKDGFRSMAAGDHEQELDRFHRGPTLHLQVARNRFRACGFEGPERKLHVGLHSMRITP
jgi:hypothetical protein